MTQLRKGKHKMSLSILWGQKIRKCSKKDRGTGLKEHRKQPESVPNGQCWNNLRYNINDNIVRLETIGYSKYL